MGRSASLFPPKECLRKPKSYFIFSDKRSTSFLRQFLGLLDCSAWKTDLLNSFHSSDLKVSLPLFSFNSPYRLGLKSLLKAFPTFPPLSMTVPPNLFNRSLAIPLFKCLVPVLPLLNICKLEPEPLPTGLYLFFAPE